jgi:hypothetical protein
MRGDELSFCLVLSFSFSYSCFLNSYVTYLTKSSSVLSRLFSPLPPPSLLGAQSYFVRPSSLSTSTLRPSILRPSALIIASKKIKRLIRFLRKNTYYQRLVLF